MSINTVLPDTAKIKSRSIKTVSHALPVVSSYNEWDPLEEVIVGVVEGATVPDWNFITKATTPDHASWFFKKYGGRHFPTKLVEKASTELEGLVSLLKKLGVTVRRPEKVDFSKEYRTPWWKSTGLYAAMPRDVLLVVGDMMIEAPMAWRSRYFEIYAYRKLLNEYFRKGARWLAAPKPSMANGFYDANYRPERPIVHGRKQYIVANSEVAFDAADFVRCGKDLFVQKSQVTNDLGIEWVRRHIGPEYNVHVVEFGDPHPMHIDTTIVPLAPGKLLINPIWVTKIPPMFKSWDILPAPPPAKPFDSAMYFSSDWLTMNFISIDEKRVIVEEQEEPLIRALQKWGFDVIAIPFRNFYPFGGSIHCATTDIRRRGTLRSYF